MKNKIFIHVFGCRTSLCEGEYIAGALKSRGFEITEDIKSDFEAAVIVTCSVTQEADRKCRALVRRVRKIMGDAGILAVCGCWGQSLDAEEAENLGIDILAGSKGKNLIPESIAKVLNSGEKIFQDLRKNNVLDFSEWEELEIDAPVFHSRAFMKIQDGCNHFCTYCIIPFLRGRPVSRPLKNILDEIKKLVASGVNEIIFTGIHLGLYGRDIDFSLGELISEVSKIKELKRLRLGSLEPFALDEKLINALRDCEAFCHHLHLPLQSGSDEILTSMRRGYSADDFLRICDKAREKISEEIHISSDILVGFPGETEKNFNETLEIMKKAKFGRVHVFPYSKRPGTLAANFPGQISHEIKISRTSQAISLGQELFDNYAKKFLNQNVEILIEKNNHGYTRNYVEANIKNSPDSRSNFIMKARALNYVDGVLECQCRA
ncbi:MAG: tRNA (N(6)-L-threonylcarbamoyladenosine(37)-C(2))-methylthiotransferase MtaB [Synergistaceae bacterium]|nr:tRNA (N(6)-L-threonylcarbamoyladenosine(37)-C(2))-methylthiotransferase MtaB [Synergistaceae bacterium]